MSTLTLLLLALSAQEEGFDRGTPTLAGKSETPPVEVILSFNMGACLLDLGGTVEQGGSRWTTTVDGWGHISPYLECWFDERWGIGLRYEWSAMYSVFAEVQLSIWNVVAGYRVIRDPSHRLEILGGALYGTYDFESDLSFLDFTGLGLFTDFPGEYRPGLGGHLGARYNWQAGNSFQLNVEVAARYLKFRLIEEDGVTGDDAGGFGVYWSFGLGWNF